MNKRKIYVVGNSFEYANWMEGKLTNVLEESDLIVFTGGEDVSPVLYGEKPHPTTGFNIRRDTNEMQIYCKALQHKKHIIGICRGSQFLCVMNGGKLVQHQNNPKYIHPISLRDGTVINITSTHHQAAYPFNLSKEDYIIIGWGDGLSEFHLNGYGEELSDIPNFKECEIVYYPHTKCLGIQGHPEHENYKYEDGLPYLQNLLNDFLNDKIKV